MRRCNSSSFSSSDISTCQGIGFPPRLLHTSRIAQRQAGQSPPRCYPAGCALSVSASRRDGDRDLASGGRRYAQRRALHDGQIDREPLSPIGYRPNGNRLDPAARGLNPLDDPATGSTRPAIGSPATGLGMSRPRPRRGSRPGDRLSLSKPRAVNRLLQPVHFRGFY